MKLSILNQRVILVLIVSLMATSCSGFFSNESPRTPVNEFPDAPVEEPGEESLDLAIIGDTPYGAKARARFPELQNAIDSDTLVSTVVHVGDTKSGKSECNDEHYTDILWLFHSFSDPLVYTPGDNEWTDCHTKRAGGYNPIERLQKLRETYFDIPGETLGGRLKTVEFQADYPENQLWVESRVLFATLHIVGSNNNLVPWFEESITEEQTEEYTNRNSANIRWLERSFDQAAAENSAGIALFFQADMRPDNPSNTGYEGFQEIVSRLAQLAEDFQKPVLLVSGDSHDFRVDEGVQWFSDYESVIPVPTVTQITIDSSIEKDIVWLRLRVDPESESVFSWEEVRVEDGHDES